jgi:hypothetical protein
MLQIWHGELLSAKTVTLSFWVRSSLTGTFWRFVRNNAQDRAYPFTYSNLCCRYLGVQNCNCCWRYKRNLVNNKWQWDCEICWGLGVGSDRSGTAGAWNSQYQLFSHRRSLSHRHSQRHLVHHRSPTRSRQCRNPV